MPSEIPKCITRPCSQNSKLVNPAFPSEFPLFHQDLWNYLFDSAQHLHNLMNRNLHAFPSPPKYSAYKNESKQLVSATVTAENCCRCFVCETASQESINTGIFLIEIKPPTNTSRIKIALHLQIQQRKRNYSREASVNGCSLLGPCLTAADKNKIT